MNSQDCFEWLSKFDAKKTTDDCYTPPAVYDAVLEYVHEQVVNLDDLKVVRPFHPSGDYTDLSQYDDRTIVVDNPPFSLITAICRFYQEHQIKFFLFAPALTIFSPMRKINGLTAVVAPATITYTNGAKVNTSFLSNITPHIKAITAPTLFSKLSQLELLKKADLPKYRYPANLVTVNILQKLCKAGLNFEVSDAESCFIGSLESQKEQGKAIFGGGLIASDYKAKELQAKELQAKELQAKKESIIWGLSDQEVKIIDRLSHAHR